MAGGDKKKKKKKRSERSRSRSPRRRERSPRRRSSSRESSSASDGAGSDRRSKGKDKYKDKSKDKDYYKSMETPEEKRARRLAKKEAKEKKRRQQMGWNNEYEGYTNTDNPFGDAHLLETFVWHKKREKHGEADLPEAEKRMADKKRQQDTTKQLERVRLRRAEREREMVLREEEKERMQRDKESTYYSAWEKQEDKFHLQQAMLRSKIRIQDGRAKPIDLLAQYISAEDDDLDIKMHEPYTFLVGLTQTDLADLLEDIKIYMELEQNKNTEYWQDITSICRDELQKLKKQHHEDQFARREGIHEAVHSDVAGIFKGKTYSQLIALEKQIYSKISSGDAVDIGYWESLLQQLKVFMAKARLKERHQKMLKDKLLQLKQQKTEAADDSAGEIELSEPESEPEKIETKTTKTVEKSPEGERDLIDDEQQPSTSKSWRDESDDEDDKNDGQEVEGQSLAIFTEEDLLEECYAAYKAGNYSPKLIKAIDVEESMLMDAEEDWQKLLALREDIQDSGTVLVNALESSTMEREEARKGMGPDEETFNVPLPLSQKTYSWEDKYRPRKPRFFNRVHTGYEWNKYNQTHYDSDNPPPKIVQGYKFNIFYPDLIDKTVAPEYFVDPEKDSPDFAILRFHAGPPYEDIAFKIVNREWEYSHRKGFRCQFHNNIFQLWFHFKRYRYRR